MAAKASDQITLVDLSDAISSVTWYQLVTSTSSAPSAPTTTKTSDKVSDWSTTEPAFDSGTTKTLYTVIQNNFRDGSCIWGEVQKSSSYEAAKEAYNKAQKAQDTVDTLQTYFWHDDTGSHVRNQEKGYQTDVIPTGLEVNELSSGTTVASFGVDGITLGSDVSGCLKMTANTFKIYRQDTGTPDIEINVAKDQVVSANPNYNFYDSSNNIKSVTLENTPKSNISFLLYDIGYSTSSTAQWISYWWETEMTPDSPFRHTFTLGTEETITMSDTTSNGSVTDISFNVTYDGDKTFTLSNVTVADTTQQITDIKFRLYYDYTLGKTSKYALGNRLHIASDIGNYATTIGYGLTAPDDYQTVIGKYNKIDTNSHYMFIIGNGTSSTATKNLFTVSTEGFVTTASHIESDVDGDRSYIKAKHYDGNTRSEGSLFAFNDLLGVYFDSIKHTNTIALSVNKWIIYSDGNNTYTQIGKLSSSGYLEASNGSTYHLTMGGGDSYVWLDCRDSSENVKSNITMSDSTITLGKATSVSGLLITTGTITSSGGFVKVKNSAGTEGSIFATGGDFGIYMDKSNNNAVGKWLITSGGGNTYCRIGNFNVQNGNILSFNNIYAGAAASSGERQIGTYHPGDSSKAIYLYANSNGREGIYSNKYSKGVFHFDSSGTLYFDTDLYADSHFIYCKSLDGGGTSRPVVCTWAGSGNRVSDLCAKSGRSFGVNGQWGGSSYTRYYITLSSSDIRLKENIEDCEVSALPVIDSIKMHQFDWKDGTGHQKIGMIADEMEELDPKFSVGGEMEEDAQSYKTIDTFYLVGYLVKAIQELHAEVEALRGGEG